MFPIVKTLECLFLPANLMALCAAIGLALLFTRRQRTGRCLVALAVAVMVAAVLAPWPMQGLEDRFPPLPAPPHVDGIIVLGGGLDPVLSAARGQPALTRAGERILALAMLARRYPGARLVYSGGSGDPQASGYPEAPVVRTLFAALGGEAGRLEIEERSRTTRENALFSRALVKPLPGEIWLLVTSAAHMSRAVGAFRAVGWPVWPWPVDYRTPGRTALSGMRSDRDLFRFDLGRRLGTLRDFAHEMLGLVYYRARGWTDALYPAPSGNADAGL